MWKHILAASGLCLILACQPVQNTGHSHGEESHNHGDEEDHSHDTGEALSYTRWTNQIELFVEFKPLVVGEVSRFAAHFTRMSDYKPITEGSVTVSLLVGDRGIRQTVGQPSSPGIFNPGLQPTTSGAGRLIFDLSTPGITERIILEDIQVFATAGEASAAMPEASESADAVDFLKEQAWKVKFAIDPVKQEAIHEVIHTSGSFQSFRSAEKVVIARSSGRVMFNKRNLQEGLEVRQGERLFTLSTQGLLVANLQEKFEVAEAQLERAKADFERAADLLEKQIIGQKEYEQRKMAYSVAQAEYQNLNASYSAAGQSISAPVAGIIQEVMVKDGQYVEEGSPLMKITNNRKVILRAEVSQKHLPGLSQIETAHFKTHDQEVAQSLADYNGRLLNYGKVLEPGQTFLPVLFELDNPGQLVPGAFVEVFLLTNPKEKALVIPRSAIMQDYDLQYVYVQTSGESFEKRVVELGTDDGSRVEVLSGLQQGEWVVTEGAYQIKMASMSSTIPAHGHSH